MDYTGDEATLKLILPKLLEIANAITPPTVAVSPNGGSSGMAVPTATTETPSSKKEKKETETVSRAHQGWNFRTIGEYARYLKEAGTM